MILIAKVVIAYILLHKTGGGEYELVPGEGRGMCTKN